MQFACANTEKSEKTKVTCANPGLFLHGHQSFCPFSDFVHLAFLQ